MSLNSHNYSPPFLEIQEDIINFTHMEILITACVAGIIIYVGYLWMDSVETNRYNRVADKYTKEELDMGSSYDFFGKLSWVSYDDLTAIQLKNRKLLQEVMLKNGFKNYPKEWWHFTLKAEPFPSTYFNFPIE